MQKPMALIYSPPIIGNIGILGAVWYDNKEEEIFTSRAVVVDGNICEHCMLLWPDEMVIAAPLLVQQKRD